MLNLTDIIRVLHTHIKPPLYNHCYCQVDGKYEVDFL